MATSVEDVQLLDALMCKTASKCDSQPGLVPTSLDGLRIGVSRIPFYENITPEVAAVVDKTLDFLRQNGAEIVYVDLPERPDKGFALEMLAYDAPRELMFYLAQNGNRLSYLDIVDKVGEDKIRDDLRSYIDPETAVTVERFAELFTVTRPALTKLFDDYFIANNLDIMVHPTTPMVAPPIGAGLDNIGQNTAVTATALLPALSVPGIELAVSTPPLPVGIEFCGPSGSDDKVLAIGRLYDDLRPPLPIPQR